MRPLLETQDLLGLEVERRGDAIAITIQAAAAAVLELLWFEIEQVPDGHAGWPVLITDQTRFETGCTSACWTRGPALAIEQAATDRRTGNEGTPFLISSRKRLCSRAASRPAAPPWRRRTEESEAGTRVAAASRSGAGWHGLEDGDGHPESVGSLRLNLKSTSIRCKASITRSLIGRAAGSSTDTERASLIARPD